MIVIKQQFATDDGGIRICIQTRRLDLNPKITVEDGALPALERVASFSHEIRRDQAVIRGASANRENLPLIEFAFERRLAFANQIFLRRDSLECR
jgi:hypothetical protein